MKKSLKASLTCAPGEVWKVGPLLPDGELRVFPQGNLASESDGTVLDLEVVVGDDQVETCIKEVGAVGMRRHKERFRP